MKLCPTIDIFLDGEKFDLRNNWTFIPRVGDTVLLKNGKILAEVAKIIWGEESYYYNGPDSRQWIQMFCKTIEKK